MPKVIDVDERRSELARAAARLIARSGIGAATLRDVAAEAGFTTGALTHYFADKRELMLWTFRESLGRREAVRDARDESDPRAALVESLESGLLLDEERRVHWIVNIAFSAEAAGDAEFYALQQAAYRVHRNHIARLVRLAGIAQGNAATAVAEQLLSCTNGVGLQALYDRDGWPPSRQLTRLHELIDPLLRA